MEKVIVKQFLLISMFLTFSLSSCQAATPPTVDPAQVQASAVAVASTMYAQTLAAIPPTNVPTDSPVPSPTDLPSPTPLPQLTLPTNTPFAVLNPSPNPGTDNCNGPLTNNPKAAPDAGKIGTNIKIVNAAKASITVSLYLNKNQQGECGFKSYVLPQGGTITIANDLPFGCYNISAFINDTKKPSYQSYGSCVNITGVDKTTINITANGIKVVGP
jgi:hypothetical protein